MTTNSPAMSRFLTPIQFEPANYDDVGNPIDDRQFKLVNPLIYSSVVANRVFTVPAGYVTDFASVPRCIPIAYALCGGCADEASALHDFLYSTHPVGREMADAVFREAMAASSVPAWRRYGMWLGVRMFGGSHW